MLVETAEIIAQKTHNVNFFGEVVGKMYNLKGNSLNVGQRNAEVFVAFVYCPMCCRKLVENTEKYLACPDQSCGFIHFNNPIPVVAGIVLMHPGIVVVQRKLPPYVGEWCLPCGYVEHKGHPPDEVIREIKEEAGIDARVLLDFGTINPNPGKRNQIITFYLCEYVSGIVRAGDDAMSVLHCVTPDMFPNLCFSTHNDKVREWRHVIDWA